MRTHSIQSSKGFTLVEILLAMFVFAIAISTIIALLARSIETADEILLKDEAINLSSALDAYMTELPFVDAYNMIRTSQPVYAYQYRGIPGDTRSNGTLEPFDGIVADSSIGEDYIITPAIRDPDTETAEIIEEMSARDGRLFYVGLSKSPANPFAAQNGGVGTLPAEPAYDSAVLVIFAEFFVAPAPGWEPPAELDPIFSFNFAVRR